MGPVEAAYGQMLSVGVVWISIHCAGMCGPLLVGLDVGGVQRGQSAWRGVQSLLTYQAGRALTYAWLGALAGLVGSSLTRFSVPAGGWITLLVGVFFLSGAALKGQLVRLPGEVTHTPVFGNRVVRVLTSLIPELGGRGSLRTLTLGVVLGFMPCMISLWALGLAATTGSALHGAGLMLLLVAMTTPMLLGATQLPRLLRAKIPALASARAPAALMGLSGVWLLLAGSAGMGWIHHAHVGFELFGRSFAVMMW